jgi:hypothetical protein
VRHPIRDDCGHLSKLAAADRNEEKLERSYVIGRNINRAYLEIEAASFDR